MFECKNRRGAHQQANFRVTAVSEKDDPRVSGFSASAQEIFTVTTCKKPIKHLWIYKGKME